VIISAVYVVAYQLMKLLPKTFQSRFGSFLSLAIFNCAVFGSIMLSSAQMLNFAKYVGFGFGTGVGFTIAYLMVSEGRRRLELSSVPRAFRGFPITLMYIGILSLAFYGLTGHQLPL
jgi:electron transport complex protein RnfA